MAFFDPPTPQTSRFVTCLHENPLALRYAQHKHPPPPPIKNERFKKIGVEVKKSLSSFIWFFSSSEDAIFYEHVLKTHSFNIQR